MTETKHMSDLIDRVAKAFANEFDTIVGHKDGWEYYRKHGRLAVQVIEAELEGLRAEVERLRAALKAIAVRAGTFEGRGSYVAYVELAGEIEKMADAARKGEEP